MLLVSVSGVLFVLLGILGTPPMISLGTRLANQTLRRTGLPTGAQSRWSTVIWGVAMISVGWVLMGLSLAAVLVSLERWSPIIERFGMFGAVGLLTATVALATVGGFVSMLPGGIGSREWILVEALGPALGTDRTFDAALIAVVLRLVWIVAELGGTLLFCVSDQIWKRPRVQGS
jgi:hypothetical protein